MCQEGKMFTATRRLHTTQSPRITVFAAALCALGASAVHAAQDGLIGPPVDLARQAPSAPIDQTDVPPVAAALDSAPTSVSSSAEPARSGGSLPLGPSSTSALEVNETQSARTVNDEPDKGAGFSRTIGAVLAVLALILISALALRALARRRGGIVSALGMGGRAPPGVLEVLGRYPVGRGHMLVLLKLDQRVLLLSQSSGGRLGAGAGFRTLCEITDPEEVASVLVKTRDDAGESMASRFRSMLAGYGAEPDPGARDAQIGATGRRVTVTEAGDATELWDDSHAAETIAEHMGDRSDGGADSSAFGSLQRRLEHWRERDGEVRA